MGKRTNRSRNGNPNAAKEMADENNYQDAFADQQRSKEQGNGKKVFNPKRNYPKDILMADSVPMDSKFGKNDDEFWIANNALVEDSAKVSLFTTTGHPFRPHYIENSLPGGTGSEAVKLRITRSAVNTPGIMSLHVMPVPGNLDSSQSPYNKGINMVFEFMQRLTGRNPDYDPNMLGIYFLAHDSAYVWWNLLTRVYGVMINWEYVNDYTPEAIVNSLGFSFADLKRHRAEFLATINQYAFELSSLPMPAIYKFITRHQRLFEAVYCDADDPKAQYLCFQPDFLWMLNEGVEANPLTTLTAMPLPRANTVKQSSPKVPLFTLDVIQSICDQLTQSLRNSTDMRMIKADILKSFGDDLVTVSPIDVDYKVKPIYDEKMLEQVENAYIYGISANYDMEIIQNPDLQDGGGLQGIYKLPLANANNFNPAGRTPDMGGDLLQALQSNDAVINFHQPGSKTPVEVMHATRFSGIGLKGAIQNTVGQYNPANCYYTGFWANAFEIISYATVTYWDASSTALGTSTEPGQAVYTTPVLYVGDFSTIFPVLMPSSSTQADAAQLMALDDLRAAICKFDWHPAYKVVQSSIESSSAGTIQTIHLGDLNIDIDNWGIISESQMALMNKAAQLSLYTPVGLGGYSPNQG